MPSVKDILSRLGMGALGLHGVTQSPIITNELSSSLETFSAAPFCPIDGPLSCHNSTSVSDSCCFIYPGGQLLLTQFWDTRPSIGPNNSWTLHGLWYVCFYAFFYYYVFLDYVLLCPPLSPKSCIPPNSIPKLGLGHELICVRQQARPLRRPLRVLLQLRATLPQHHRHPHRSQPGSTSPDNARVLAAQPRFSRVLLDA